MFSNHFYIFTGPKINCKFKAATSVEKLLDFVVNNFEITLLKMIGTIINVNIHSFRFNDLIHSEVSYSVSTTKSVTEIITTLFKNINFNSLLGAKT